MSLEYIQANTSKIKRIVIDTNLLLLLLMGLYDESQIGKHKRLQKFRISDFHHLAILIDVLKKELVLTPHILTEICNLSDSYNKQTNYSFFAFLKQIIFQYEEHNPASKRAINIDETGFLKLGLADAGLISLAKDNSLVVTDDFELYHYLSSKGNFVINYTHLMDLN